MRNLDGNTEVFFQIPEWCRDTELIGAVAACIEMQRAAASGGAGEAFEPFEGALDAVSPQALAPLLAAGRNVHGISREPEISNVISFSGPLAAPSVRDRKVVRQRHAVDRLVTRRIRGELADGSGWEVVCSGHFWYPPGGYMAWHTNSLSPGWRMYVSHAESPGKSFFRYRHPVSGEIVTDYDEAWNVRVFRVSREMPFWHAVYSDTNRFSLGYVVQPRRPLASLKRRVTGALRKLRR